MVQLACAVPLVFDQLVEVVLPLPGGVDARLRAFALVLKADQLVPALEEGVLSAHGPPLSFMGRLAL